MKIGLFSDTHGNLKNLKAAADFLVSNLKVDTLIHLGDNFSDADILFSYRIPVIRVPGVYEEVYKDPNIQKRVIKRFEDIQVLITHTQELHENDTPEDLNPKEVVEAGLVKAVFYGHTHVPLVDERRGVLFINPGHLKDEDKKGFLPSFGFVEINQNEIEAIIYSLNDKIKIVSGKLFSSTI